MSADGERLRPHLKGFTRDCERCPAFVHGPAALSILGQRVGWKQAATLRGQPRPMLCTWGRRLMILVASPRSRHCGLLTRARVRLRPILQRSASSTRPPARPVATDAPALT